MILGNYAIIGSPVHYKSHVLVAWSGGAALAAMAAASQGGGTRHEDKLECSVPHMYGGSERSAVAVSASQALWSALVGNTGRSRAHRMRRNCHANPLCRMYPSMRCIAIRYDTFCRMSLWSGSLHGVLWQPLPNTVVSYQPATHQPLPWL